MECADGVCKFVPRSQRGVQIGGNEENVEPALPPVSVGDKPPMPLIFETLEEGGGSFSLQRLCAAGEDGGRVVVLGESTIAQGGWRGGNRCRLTSKAMRRNHLASEKVVVFKTSFRKRVPMPRR